jgi:multiple sugar transport system ATP-binding protein
MAVVTFDSITKYFGKVGAVKNLNLSINEGEFMVLLGPSGCGKTTTMRLVAGLEKATEGTISFNGQVVNNVPVRERNVSMVFQIGSLFPHMSVFNNIAFPLHAVRWPRDKIRERVKEVSEQLQIEELLSRKPHELSGGQAQRVALGRGLVRKPEVLLLDEPLASVDAKLRDELRVEIRKIQEIFKCTTIYVTHDQVEAMSIADRIAVMNLGELQQEGVPDELYYRPKNTFVADFIGRPPMNLLECSYDESRGLLNFGAFTLPIPEAARGGLSGRRELIVGVRPEDLSITTEGNGENTFNGRIYVMENLGGETIITADVGERQIRIKTESDLVSQIKATMDIQITLNNTNRMHFFDKQTRENVVYSKTV